MATVKSSQVNITDLDFDDIADNLKEYLKGQTTLKDYNFEGSNTVSYTHLTLPTILLV